MRKLTHNLKIKAKKRMKNCGFTMVELIVVVAILGVLAAILIPTLLGITIRATVGSANTTASELKKQIGYFLTMADANRKNYMLMGKIVEKYLLFPLLTERGILMRRRTRQHFLPTQ